jgi:hypothetical protein
VTRGLAQLDQLVGQRAVESKKYPGGRGHTKVAPTEGGVWEFSEDGTCWKVGIDLTYSKVRG